MKIAAKILASLQLFFCVGPILPLHKRLPNRAGHAIPRNWPSQQGFKISVAKFPRISDDQNMPEFSDACKVEDRELFSQILLSFLWQEEYYHIYNIEGHH